MSDEIDATQDRMEHEAELRAKYKPVVEEIKPTGVCLFCGEVLCFGGRWCGPDCRDEWERRRK